jgi:two-component system, NtrC family, sensor kinase
MRGLRIQILLALGALLVLAFVPLYGALAASSQAAFEQTREDAARSLGRAIAAHVADHDDPATIAGILQSHIGTGGAIAVAVYGNGGRRAEAGDVRELGNMLTPTPPFGEGASVSEGVYGRVLDVTVPKGQLAVVARVRLDDARGTTSGLLRLVALYTLIFGIALLTFAYFVLTRLIVKPIEAIGGAADRVARGAADLEVPRVGAAELIDLGESLRRMTLQLKGKEEALERKVVELSKTTSNLSAARTQLEGSDRLASVGRLAAGVAHEIGNPITAMMGMQDLLLEGGLEPAMERDFVARMRRETERVHTIVRDLLDFSRAQKEGEEPGSVALAAQSTVDLVNPQKGMREVALDTKIAPDLPQVSLSTPRLTQVLLNLVLNARDALAQTSEPRIRIEASAQDALVEIAVVDNGPGIPIENAEKVFQPFFTTKDVGEGTGLGLSVCRGLVEAVRGSIQVDPAHTSGTRIVISLPRAHSS